MKVKEKIFYQIAKNRNFKVGDVLHFGENNNGQVDMFDYSFTYENQPLHKFAFEDAKKGIFKNKERIKKYAIALSEYDLLLRELALEEVRKEKFQNLPSRFKCMYLFTEKQQMFKAFEYYKKNKSETQVQAIAVKVTGEVFYYDPITLGGRKGRSYNEHIQNALDFWEQTNVSEDNPKEALFIGDSEVIEIFDEIKK